MEGRIVDEGARVAEVGSSVANMDDVPMLELDTISVVLCREGDSTIGETKKVDAAVTVEPKGGALAVTAKVVEDNSSVAPMDVPVLEVCVMLRRVEGDTMAKIFDDVVKVKLEGSAAVVAAKVAEGNSSVANVPVLEVCVVLRRLEGDTVVGETKKVDVAVKVELKGGTGVVTAKVVEVNSSVVHVEAQVVELCAVLCNEGDTLIGETNKVDAVVKIDCKESSLFLDGEVVGKELGLGNRVEVGELPEKVTGDCGELGNLVVAISTGNPETSNFQVAGDGRFRKGPFVKISCPIDSYILSNVWLEATTPNSIRNRSAILCFCASFSPI